MKQYDAVIIGFGKAGKTLAAELAAHDWSVAMVERSDKMYGGTCINIGCIPTKALIHSAGLAAAGHPLTFGQRRDYYRESVASKTALVDLLRDKNYHKLADNARIDVYTGEGSFASPETVAVKTTQGTQQIGGKYIVINTGAETVIPPIEGIAQSRRVYTSTSIMELEELPQHLVIVGGGYIGLEFASMYASFGSKVTVLEGFAELIPREDRDIAAAVREALEKKGIEFRIGARVESVSDTAGGVRVAVADTQTGGKYEIDGDAVLLATGRRPATAGLNLEAAGIETDDRGAVRVDAHLRTTAPRVFAAGDVTGGLQFTYVSLDDFRIIRDGCWATEPAPRPTGAPFPIRSSSNRRSRMWACTKRRHARPGATSASTGSPSRHSRVRGYWVRRRVCSKPSSTPRPTRYWGARSSEPNRAKSSTPSPQP